MSLSNVTAPGNVSTSTIPQCAITCTISVVPLSDCKSYGISNFTCLCTSQDFQTQFLNCQKTACTAPEFQAAEAFGASSCAAVGHPIQIINGYNSPATSSSAAGSVASASTTPKSAGKKNSVAVGLSLLMFVGVGLIL